MLSKEVSKYLNEFFNNDLYEQAIDEIKKEDEEDGKEFESYCGKIKEMCGDNEDKEPMENSEKEEMDKEGMDKEHGLSIYIGKIKKSKGY